MRLAAILLAAAYVSTDTVALTVDSRHPVDSVTVLCDDARRTYQPVQVEVASLAPYCLAMTAGAPGFQPTPLWHDCYGPGRNTVGADEMKVPPILGGQGRTIAIAMTAPFDNERAATILRFTVAAEPVELDAGAPAPRDGGADAGHASPADAGFDGGRR